MEMMKPLIVVSTLLCNNNKHCLGHVTRLRHVTNLDTCVITELEQSVGHLEMRYESICEWKQQMLLPEYIKT